MGFSPVGVSRSRRWDPSREPADSRSARVSRKPFRFAGYWSGRGRDKRRAQPTSAEPALRVSHPTDIRRLRTPAVADARA